MQGESGTTDSGECRYRAHDMWDDAIRVAKSHGGVNASKQVSSPALYTLYPTPYTLHPTPYTLHPKPYTLNPTP